MKAFLFYPFGFYPMGNSSSQKKLEVAAAVIVEKGKYLITKRLKTSHLGHCWEFPGGKIELGETIEACAVRECEEEVGIEVKPRRILKDLWYSYPEVEVHVHFVLCEMISGTPKPIECEEARWITPAEFSEYEFPAADIKIIEELQGL